MIPGQAREGGVAEGWTRRSCWPLWSHWRSRSPTASTTPLTPSPRWWPPELLALAAVCNLLGPLLLGAAVAEAGAGAVNWGGVGGGHPTGVIGTLVASAISPVLGFGAAWAMELGVRRGLRRATTRANPPVLRAQWLT
jgi:hypothetical protein